MITDKLKNIENYNFPVEAVSFIKSISDKIKIGKVVLSDNVYANVEMYNTKSVEIGKFESHKKYIDIQILLKGKEYIYFADVDKLDEIPVYDENRDIIFYNKNINEGYKKIELDGSNFAVFYPEDAHAPQIGDGTEVLKVVVKIKANI